jgi:quinol monooxygenase YgiN
MLIIAGHFWIDPKNLDTALAAAKEMMTETLKEKGCLAYVFSADFSDPARFHLFERWESQTHLDAHFVTPHMARFQAAIGKLGVRDMDVKKYAISGVGPVF